MQRTEQAPPDAVQTAQPGAPGLFAGMEMGAPQEQPPMPPAPAPDFGNAPGPLQSYLNNPYNRQQALNEFEKAGIKGDPFAGFGQPKPESQEPKQEEKPAIQEVPPAQVPAAETKP